MPTYMTLEEAIGHTPLVRLQRVIGAEIAARGNVILGKLEGNNPAGSVKDRPAISMIRGAEERGQIKPGDTLIEATSGNTGIALAMAAAIKGYRMVLIMPEDLSIERVQTMKAYGAELILTPKSGGMEYARDLALQMQADGKGLVLDQFANPDNPRVHYETTGPEIWHDTDGQITHFVSAMGTTGTITGVSRFLKEKNPAVRILGAQPAEGSRIPGIRKWPEAYQPKIYEPSRVDELILVQPGRRRGHGAPPRARGRPVRGHLGGRRVLGGAAGRAAARERDHRVRRLRPRRPLPVDRRVSGMTRHAPMALLPAVRQRARVRHAGRGRRPEGAPALRALRLHALEQPDAGARGDRRMLRPRRQVLLARNAAWAGRMFALITGFMEAGETPEEGIAREVLEETNADGRVHEADRRVGLPAHEPGHHRVPRGGARRDRAVARTGRVQAVRAGRHRLLAGRHRLRGGRVAASRGIEPKFMSFEERAAQAAAAAPPKSPDAS
jgi:cysteine synthase B